MRKPQVGDAVTYTSPYGNGTFPATIASVRVDGTVDIVLDGFDPPFPIRRLEYGVPLVRPMDGGVGGEGVQEKASQRPRQGQRGAS